jgi:hypothetical protein
MTKRSIDQQPVRPRNNKEQNKQVHDAARDEKLDINQRYRLSEIIENDSRQRDIQHDYHTIREVARQIREGEI